ncbi:MAG: phage tail tape measure protein [Eubacteriales bacterium]|nr:phage tail tape measure protein [Eubacteriales bacterium]
MANRIKGITVEIGGDTTGLDKALKSVNTSIKSTQSALKDVNRLLKLDPSNTELLSQKQRLLKDAIGATKEKLDSLKAAQEQAKQQLENGELGQDKYDALQREIVETEEELRRLQQEATTTSTALSKIDVAGQKMEAVGNSIAGAGKKMMGVTTVIGGVGVAAVKTAADFDSAMSQVAAVSGATGKDFDDLRNKAREMGSKTKFSATEAAEAMNYIYREYLEGLSMDKIAAGLERDGILTGAGKAKWHTSTINKILRNEKYIGDALLQKTYTTDFLNKTRVKNNGLIPQYYVEGNHEAIIPKEIYLQVQEELVRRRVVKTSANGKKRSYSCNHCFSQIVICGECGEMFRRLHWNNRGVKSIVWRCISRLESTGLECHARTINELVLQDAIVKAINQMLGDKSSYQAQLQLNIASVIRASQATSVENIDEKLMSLQQELIQKAQSKEVYDEIADEIFRLRELRQQTTVDTAARDEQIKRINDLQDYISQQTAHLTEFDESLVRRWVKQITIWDDRITVELKSGVSIDVDA